MNRQQWLEERKKGIGGSDISAIIGVNQYTTPYELWLEKTGRAESTPDNPTMRRGKILEPAVVGFWQEESKYGILEESQSLDKIYYHKDYPFLFGTPDRLYVNEEGKKGVLECKTTLINIDAEELPQSWFCQIQWYMGITGCEIGEVCVLGKFFKVDRIQYNFVPDFFDELVRMAIEFREKYILTDLPPEPINENDVKTMFSKHINGKSIEASPETLDSVRKLKLIKESIKELETEEKLIAEEIKMILRDAESMSYEGKTLLTWKANKDGEKFDNESFKLAHPDLYKKFLKPTIGARQLRLKEFSI